MSVDFTGINNQHEFFTNFYLTSEFESDIKEELQRWLERAAKENTKTPYDQLHSLRHEFFLLRDKVSKLRIPQLVQEETQGFIGKLLITLGYPIIPTIKETENGYIPVISEIKRNDGMPWLWVLPTYAVDSDEIKSPLKQHFLYTQYPSEVDIKNEFYENNDIEALISGEVFGLENPPRWIIAISYNSIALIDRSKWADKRLLSFDVEEILDRREISTLKAMTVLLHKEHLCPDSGSPFIDNLDDNSNRNAFSVSEDLKYAAREAVELMGNEAVWYLKNKVHQKVYNLDSDLAKQLSEESLRYLYRLLFLFYIEARAEKLGYVPLHTSDIYRTGYSLDSLRDLEMVPLLTTETQDGYFFDESIKMLFSMIGNGVYPKNVKELDLCEVKYEAFSIPRIESHLFSLEKTPLLKTVKFRNKVWQKIIQLLSLTREGASKRRGRISYSQLGIIQLGAVYEGLLSYRGFFAETDLYEVIKTNSKSSEETDESEGYDDEDEEEAKTATKWDPLKQAYFVTRKQLDEDYDEKEKVIGKDGHYLKHEKGKFIYRLAGRDREKSASYYTPKCLTQCLVKYALKELIGEKPDDTNYKTADEILELTVCEPAMGSAAFLNEAVDQLADAYLNRKQKETGIRIPHDQIEEEVQKVKTFIVDRNVYGVDLNPVAVELAEISLWLNSITNSGFVPWFGGQLICGNSLIGARKQVYDSSLLTGKGKTTWLSETPVRVMPRQHRPNNTIYHFMLPDKDMANYNDSVIKKMAKNEIDKINKWRKEFIKNFSIEDVKILEKLSCSVDDLWLEHTKQLRKFRTETTDALSIFEHVEKESNNKSLADKDTALMRDLYSENVTMSTPYRRLKMVMDYWCALWFWPIEEADNLPTRDQFLFELQYIIEGEKTQEYGTGTDDTGQGYLFPTEERQKKLDFSVDLGKVSIDALCETFPRLKLVEKIAKKQRFMHWELEFADIFEDRGGFDLVVGNPPWVKLTWNEKGILSDYQPLFAIKKMSASAVSVLRNSTIDNFNLRKQYFAEYESISGNQNYLKAYSNYPALRNIQTNLFKCFLPQAWQITSKNAISGFIHPEGIYSDSEGIAFRKEVYSRLRYHFQFINTLRLFKDIDGRNTYSINIYGNQMEPHFLQINNLFNTNNLDSCFTNEESQICGLKNENGKWNTIGSKNRVINIGKQELELFNNLYADNKLFGFDSTILPSLYLNDILAIIKKLYNYSEHIYDYNKEFKATAMFDETNAVKKEHTIKRNTSFPVSAYELILSGPHIYCNNPCFKTPKEVCNSRSAFDLIDLSILPHGYLPRTNYIPDCNHQEYINRMPYAEWDERIDVITGKKIINHRLVDYFRLAFRRRICPTNERSLMAAIIPDKYAHVNVVQSVVHKDSLVMNQKQFCFDKLLNVTASCYSLIGDFFVKTTGRVDLFWNTLSQLPYIDDNRLKLRVLLLSCLTASYSHFWKISWRKEFNQDIWSKLDTRLDNKLFTNLSEKLDLDSTVKSDYIRRQMLVEIDVIIAREIGLTLEELCTMYNVQFTIFKENEDNTYYDQNGRIVFTTSKGLKGTGVDKKTWTKIKDMKSGEYKDTKKRNLNWLPKEQRESIEPYITYVAPFDKCDREQDYATAWAFFDEQDKKNK